jgi:hypothetical protein
MKIKARSTNPAPDDSYVWGITDVTDTGIKTSKWGPRPTLRVTGTLNKADPLTGQPFRISKIFNVSVDPRSGFHAFVKLVTGNEPKLDRMGEFDCDSLIGLQCEIETRQRITSKGTFANIIAIRPLSNNTMRVPIPIDLQDRAVAFPAD